MSDTEIRALFILKKRHNYGHQYNFQAATGMYNSANFVAQALSNSDHRIRTAVVLVNDNNEINTAVHTAFPKHNGHTVKPTHVFIEGLWVVPSKFDNVRGSLVHLNPGVKWIVRIHSEIPFLSGEGQALAWITEYLKRGIGVACNSPKADRELDQYFAAAGISHRGLMPMLPNIYPIDFLDIPAIKKDGVIDIGCFGAIRPLKNQLQQAFWAVEFAKRNGMPLRFHINNVRIEANGNNALKNIQAFFAALPSTYKLVEHGWEDRDSFLKTMAGMDLSMQVSFSETFNIVSADAIYAGVPIVASKEIPWSAPPHADPTNSDTSLAVMQVAFDFPTENINMNRRRLRKLRAHSIHDWMHYFGLTRDGLLQHLFEVVGHFVEDVLE